MISLALIDFDRNAHGKCVMHQIFSNKIKDLTQKQYITMEQFEDLAYQLANIFISPPDPGQVEEFENRLMDIEKKAQIAQGLIPEEDSKENSRGRNHLSQNAEHAEEDEINIAVLQLVLDHRFLRLNRAYKKTSFRRSLRRDIARVLHCSEAQIEIPEVFAAEDTRSTAARVVFLPLDDILIKVISGQTMREVFSCPPQTLMMDFVGLLSSDLYIENAYRFPESGKVSFIRFS